jgi:polyisoprenoid-binding protein YceI
MEEAMNSAPATVAIPGYLVGTWKADPVHSESAFSVRHLMVSKVRGRFTFYDVTIVTSEDPRDSSVAATLHGVTRQVPLTGEVNGFGPDLRGGQRAGFSATEQISRRDFGIDISIPVDGGRCRPGHQNCINTRKEAGR